MNDTLILPILPNASNSYQPLDCSGLTVKMCDNLLSNFDAAIIMIGIGIILQFVKNLKHDDPISNYLHDSILPDMFIFMGFGFMFFVGFLA